MTSPLELSAFALAGAAAWSFLEYVIHRALGHRWPGNPFGAEHVRHHATTSYFAPSWKKVVVSTPVILAFGALAALPLGPAAGAAFTAGLAAAYAGYEVLHRRIHTHGPRGPYGRWVRRNHLHHHFHAPAMNFGVTTPLWDLVFRTHAPPAATIRVPEKHAMPWLLDERGEVRPGLAGDYALLRRRTAPRQDEPREAALGARP